MPFTESPQTNLFQPSRKSFIQKPVSPYRFPLQYRPINPKISTR
ncbi:hypothetical protein NEISICOT_02193 [Neisseria sicca ATCC 29256]|uniref:Uncharacterized protein n=1 Tax=Neisseria sicca ATCC 29256 TaxID=547045 RepID=C6M6P1_NEISI|nr:hypothetical protein NEISICOT_02193 [Neisseria sicca ATCC 29256]